MKHLRYHHELSLVLDNIQRIEGVSDRKNLTISDGSERRAVGVSFASSDQLVVPNRGTASCDRQDAGDKSRYRLTDSVRRLLL
jgi:hypothetical protein